ncbi:MAG TPA: class I SAM-dependent rRNA methyltransferase [bacterium]|nr:class I SAM-dependent rRNA methyltransferase [bacterium]
MPSYVRVELKRKEEGRLLAGHPWVFANEVDGIPKVLAQGSLVEVITSEGKPVGRGVANPTSKILIRLLTHGFDRELDAALIEARVDRALHLREGLKAKAGTDGLRILFGEADGLPGVIADAFGDNLVLSCFSAGMKHFIPDLVAAFQKRGFKSVYEKSAGETVQKEGMAEFQGWRTAPGSLPFHFTEGKARFRVNPEAGQKTGFYLDFREARRRVFEMSAGRSILDAFAYTGASSIQAALGGAREVLALESSQTALDEGLENAKLNGVEGKIAFERQDSFKVFRELKKTGRTFDGILLDPPPLAKSVHELPAGRSALKRMMGNALDLLNPGGFLIVASCSHHFSWTVLEGTVREAVEESGRSFHLAERLTQPPDHPMVVAIPETEYLRALVLTEADF